MVASVGSFWSRSASTPDTVAPLSMKPSTSAETTTSVNSERNVSEAGRYRERVPADLERPVRIARGPGMIAQGHENPSEPAFVP